MGQSIGRSSRIAMARQTVDFVARGAYELPGNRVVPIRDRVEACLAGTRHYPPEQLEKIRGEVLGRPVSNVPAAIEVRGETTLAGIFRLQRKAHGPVAALNFASAKNPGGGFLNGSEAQEESLARSSALHASLLRAPEYYERNRALASLLYSDSMVWSPDCPVFRNDKGELLARPTVATFVSVAAPNAKAVRGRSPEELSLIEPTLLRRSEYILALFAWHGCAELVLGAWGCGVFGNDPVMVARAFATHLGPGGRWAGRFQRVVFSILDSSPNQDTLLAFQRVFRDPPC